MSWISFLVKHISYLFTSFISIYVYLVCVVIPRRKSRSHHTYISAFRAGHAPKIQALSLSYEMSIPRAFCGSNLANSIYASSSRYVAVNSSLRRTIGGKTSSARRARVYKNREAVRRGARACLLRNRPQTRTFYLRHSVGKNSCGMNKPPSLR